MAISGAIRQDPMKIGLDLLRKKLEAGYSVKRQLDGYSGRIKEEIATSYGNQALKRGEYKIALEAYEQARSPERLLTLASALFAQEKPQKNSGQIAAESMFQARRLTPEGDSQHGKIIEAGFYSQSLEKEKKYNVYLPPGYENSEERYPVVYLFHGIDGNHNDWTTNGEIRQVADELISKGLMQKSIIVMPDMENGIIGKETEIPWLMKVARFLPPNKIARKGDYENYIVKDLITEIDNKYQTIREKSGRAADGFCLGAFNAMEIALKHPDRFSSVAGHTGIYKKPNLTEKAKDIKIYVDASRLDPLIFYSRKFCKELEKTGIKSVFSEYSGKPGIFSRGYWTKLRKWTGHYSGRSTPLRIGGGMLLTGITSHNWRTIIERLKDSLMYHSINFENATKKKD